MYQAEKYEAALEEYTKAIELSPQDGVLYSNRSACYAALEQWNECLADATTCLKLKPDWFKSYYRRALALHMMRRNVEARGLCSAGLALEPENKELKGLKLKCNEPICREFANASAIDFRMDRPPSEDFKLVLKGKSPVKGAQLNGLAFPQTLRTMLHTAVMCQYPKIVKVRSGGEGGEGARDRRKNRRVGEAGSDNRRGGVGMGEENGMSRSDSHISLL